MITWLGDVLRAADLKVIETNGWKTRTRPYSFLPRAVMFHHTASNRNGGDAPALNTVTFGRPDLPGPLCNVLVSRSGICYLIAAGRCNHAGYGGPWRDIPKDSGNLYSVGIEVENDGIGEPWPEHQLDVCFAAFAAICEQLKVDHGWMLGHKEWAPDRKIDPARIDMKWARTETAAAMEGEIDVTPQEFLTHLGIDAPSAGNALGFLAGMYRRMGNSPIADDEKFKAEAKRRGYDFADKVLEASK